MPVDNNEHQGIDDVFTDRYTVTRDNGFRFVKINIVPYVGYCL